MRVLHFSALHDFYCFILYKKPDDGLQLVPQHVAEIDKKMCERFDILYACDLFRQKGMSNFFVKNIYLRQKYKTNLK